MPGVSLLEETVLTNSIDDVFRSFGRCPLTMKHISTSFVLSLLVSVAGVAHAATDCEALNKAGFHLGASIPGCDSGRAVVGQGRLQFYSAPALRCKMQGTFIVPGDQVVAYTEHNGFTSVMYLHPKTQEDTMGWVSSNRLRRTGTGIAPCR